MMGILEKCSRCSQFQNAYQNTSPGTCQWCEVDVRNSSHNKKKLFGNPSTSEGCLRSNAFENLF